MYSIYIYIIRNRFKIRCQEDLDHYKLVPLPPLCLLVYKTLSCEKLNNGPSPIQVCHWEKTFLALGGSYSVKHHVPHIYLNIATVFMDHA